MALVLHDIARGVVFLPVLLFIAFRCRIVFRIESSIILFAIYNIILFFVRPKDYDSRHHESNGGGLYQTRTVFVQSVGALFGQKVDRI